MSRPRLPRPTDGELAILRILWERGLCTIRQVHDQLSSDRDFSYTSTQKLFQIMTEKGLVIREEWGHLHRYSPAVTAEETQKLLVEDLAARAFGGSATQLMVRALASAEASEEEL